MAIPSKYTAFVGKRKIISEYVFSSTKCLPPTEYMVLDIRWGEATVINLVEKKAKGESSYEHPTYQLLLKSDAMKASRWSRPFPIREINLKKNDRHILKP